MLDDFTKLKVHLEQVAADNNLNIFQVMQRICEDHPVPCSVFCRKLSPLESVVKFMHETYGYSFTRIAQLLGKNPKTVWQSAHNAARKHPEHFAQDYQHMIPLSVFSGNKASLLFPLISYLHEYYSLNFARIAELTERDPRTIWTTYNKYRKPVRPVRGAVR